MSTRTKLRASIVSSAILVGGPAQAADDPVVM